MSFKETFDDYLWVCSYPMQFKCGLVFPDVVSETYTTVRGTTSIATECPFPVTFGPGRTILVMCQVIKVDCWTLHFTPHDSP